MNIKIITYDNFPFGGASANLLRYFSLALALEDNDVEVILPTGNNYGNINSDLKKNGKVENVSYRHLLFKNHPKNIMGKLFDILAGQFLVIISLLNQSFRRKVDIIIVYNISFSSIALLILIKKLLKKKLVVILPEFYEKQQLGKGLMGTIKWNDFNLGIRHLVKYIDGFFVASHFLKKYLEKERFIKKPIYVLPNLMDPDIFISDKKTPYIKNKITIGYTGIPTRKDGVVDLIKSFAIINKKFPHTHLLIVGDTPTRGKSVLLPLKELAKNLLVLKNITFTGLVSFTEIPNLLNQCQILALTRPKGVFAEAGFPTKLGEYFACKKPVLITNVGDVSLYFKSGQHVIISEPDNIESIVNGFETLIESHEIGNIISENAYQWMLSNLSYRNVSRNLGIFINEITK